MPTARATCRRAREPRRHPLNAVAQALHPLRQNRLSCAQHARAGILQTKDFRRVATLYDKLAQIFLTTITIAAVILR